MKQFAVILGASGGIGEAIAREFAEGGWSLYMHWHSKPLNTLAEELSARFPSQEFIPVQADFSAADGAERLAAQIYDASCVVAASGHELVKMLIDTTAEEMDLLWRVHVQNPVTAVRKLSPFFHRRPKSYVIFISSVWGEAGASMETVYSAVKGAQLSFVKAYAKEMASAGTRVNAVAPGFIETKMNRHLNSEELEAIAADIPLGIGTAQDVAYLAAFLASGKADYITGQTLSINGGWYI